MKNKKERQQAVLDHRSEQKNPTNPKYYRARGDTLEGARLRAEVADLKCRKVEKKV